MIANSTVDKAVYRSDGIQLYGLDAELELKVLAGIYFVFGENSVYYFLSQMQGKRDKNYEKELGKWITQVSVNR